MPGNVLKWLGLAGTEAEEPLTQRAAEALYTRPRSFIDHLPWTEYLEADRAFLLDDGRSVGALEDGLDHRGPKRVPGIALGRQVVAFGRSDVPLHHSVLPGGEDEVLVSREFQLLLYLRSVHA